jgi:hypothetical protein
MLWPINGQFPPSNDNKQSPNQQNNQSQNQANFLTALQISFCRTFPAGAWKRQAPPSSRLE